MKRPLICITCLAASSHLGLAASIAVAHYEMGEQELSGTGLGATPATLVDSIGGVDMVISGGGTAPIVATPSPAPGSTHALDMSADGTYYSINDNLVHANDGFLVEGWAMATSPYGSAASYINTVFSYGHGGGGILVAQRGNDGSANAGSWGTFVGGVGWVGAGWHVDVGEWTHLAIVQAPGDLFPSFWVNGIDLGPIAENDNTVAGSAIGDQFSGGGHQFDGLVDDVWYSSVSGTFDPATDFQSFVVPEPLAPALLGLTGLAFLCRRRR